MIESSSTHNSPTILPGTNPVVIVGAGPGGSVAALALARQGIRSVVVDKATFPRPKPCGDVITSQTLRVLERLGLDPSNDLPLVRAQATWGTTCIAPNGKAVDVSFKPLHKETEIPSCYTLQRASFDNYLVEQLRANPLIELREGVGVKDAQHVDQQWQINMADGTNLPDTKLLLLASGCNSSLARQISNQSLPAIAKEDDRHFGVGLRGYFRDKGGWRQAGMPEFYIMRELMPGGLYLTPLANGLVNVNMVMRRDYVLKNGINLRDRFWEVLASHPTLSKRFAPDTLEGQLQGSSLSFGTIKRGNAGNGLMMIGDAAGLIDLLSANGICNAVMSAEIAAGVAVQAIQHQDYSMAFLGNYDSLLDQKLGNELKLGRLVSPFLGNERLFGLFEGVLNFVASRVQGGSVLSQLLYHPDVSKLLRSPSFYKQMVWG